MHWARQFVAVFVLWLMFSGIAVMALILGYAGGQQLGLIPGADPWYGAQLAGWYAEYLACGALAVSTTLIYSGFVRLKSPREPRALGAEQ